ncbi:MAG TPA: hypothetical protein VF559_07815 [Caulobacteraceae bacterium]|jgi:hypothetical protein
MRALRLAVLLTLTAASAAAAPRRPAPAPEPPPPTPKEYWEAPEVFLTEAQDPFGRRRASRNETAPRTPGAPEPSYYRLWGLQPLQTQFLRGDEAIMEVWVRTEGGQRQALVRVSVRGDGRSFVQARAGIACCSPTIGRRVDVDAELPPGSAAGLEKLAGHGFWSSLPDVVIDEGDGSVEPLCVGGVSYDFYLLRRDRFARLRRDCGGAEVGEAAEVLGALLGAAVGRDPRFDFLFPRGADFSEARSQHQALLTRGGRLVASKPR